MGSGVRGGRMVGRGGGGRIVLGVRTISFWRTSKLYEVENIFER